MTQFRELREVEYKFDDVITKWDIYYVVKANGKSRTITLINNATFEELLDEWLDYHLVEVKLNFEEAKGIAVIGDTL